MKKNGLTWKDAFDYSMSWNTWRSLCVEHGEPDPGPDRPAQDTPIEVRVDPPPDKDLRRAEFLHLRNRLNEHIDKSRKITAYD
jgi:hypothetical protein